MGETSATIEGLEPPSMVGSVTPDDGGNWEMIHEASTTMGVRDIAVMPGAFSVFGDAWQ